MIKLQWSRLPDLPANPVCQVEEVEVGGISLGLGGPVVGSWGNFLLVAGGSSFPEPGGTVTRPNTLGKVYWDDVFVLEGSRWQHQVMKLPFSLAHAATLSTERGVLVLGGEGFPQGVAGLAGGGLKVFDHAFLMRPEQGKLVLEDLPSLPEPLTLAVAGQIGSQVYVSQGHQAYSLDLDKPQSGWTTLPPLPVPRDVPVGGAVGGRFYVLSGRARRQGVWSLDRDGFAYDPLDGQWHPVAPIPQCVAAGTVMTWHDRYLLTVGGDGDLQRFNRIMQVLAEREQHPRNSQDWRQANGRLTQIYDHHAGFNPEMYLYDTQTNQWSLQGYFPGIPPVTTPAVPWQGGWVVATGESGPGVRVPHVWLAREVL
jgi:N-acetylneuraminate epimerase